MTEEMQIVYIKAYGTQWKSSWWWRSHLRVICRVLGHKWGPGGNKCLLCGGFIAWRAYRPLLDNLGLSSADVRHAPEDED